MARHKISVTDRFEIRRSIDEFGRRCTTGFSRGGLVHGDNLNWTLQPFSEDYGHREDSYIRALATLWMAY